MISTVMDWLDMWADRTPEATLLAERSSSARWETVTYAQFHWAARRIAQGLLDRGLSFERPLVILERNSREHALVAMGALYAGVPYISLSTGASRFSQWERVTAVCQPGLVFTEQAIAAEFVSGQGLVTSTHALGAEVRNLPRLGAATVAKILFTSGSTGSPKGVIQTHKMLTSNQDALATVLGRTESSTVPVICDWLPWHHTFGGNHNFYYVLRNGGTMYIDGGRPTAEGIATTVQNLADVKPTACFNVPLGFELLVERLRLDASFGRQFFSRLEFLFAGGAVLRREMRAALEELGLAATGRRIPVVSGYGATETAPLSLFHDGKSSAEGYLGKPVPDVTVKLAAMATGFELRVKGPNVTPGYWNAGVHQLFDKEGFYCTGDAAEYANGIDEADGYCFLGRLLPTFKLSNGTWVDPAALREHVLRLGGCLISDCVIGGEMQGEVIAFLKPTQGLSDQPDYQARLASLLAELTDIKLGSSHRLGSVVLVDDVHFAETTWKDRFDKNDSLRKGL